MVGYVVFNLSVFIVDTIKFLAFFSGPVRQEVVTHLGGDISSSVPLLDDLVSLGEEFHAQVELLNGGVGLALG